MEAIRNYLETMFVNLPNTPEVQRAKYELGQMMEDKYNELIAKGKTENEAIGTVIAEFGNLDELAESLGIDSYLRKDTYQTGRMITMEETRDYLRDNSKNAFLTALGVLLCITSPVGTIIMDAVCEQFLGQSAIFNALGVMCLFAFIAIAVAIFIFSGVMMSKWKYLETQHCCLDFATTEYVHDQRNLYKTVHALLLSIGIMLCIFCATPAIIADALHVSGYFEDMMGAGVLLIVAVGVFMIVMTSIRMGGYTKLLRVNNQDSMGGQYVDSQKNEHYDNKTVAVIMSVFWPTVSCIYLVWSFLTFDWYITWIIWPIASVIHKLIKNIWSN